MEALLLAPQAAEALAARDNDGGTPLCSAVSAGQREVVRLLLANGAAPNSRDACGRAPLYRAAELGLAEVIAPLLSAGADPSVPNDEGCSPLYVGSSQHADGA